MTDLHWTARRLSRWAGLLLAAWLAVGNVPGRAEDELKPATPDFPEELVNFAPYEHNPIFTARGPGHWDERIRERGWILRDTGLWRMWYTGYQPSGTMKLGYATSPDGIRWTRSGDGPIFDEVWTEDMMVVPHQGRLYMFAEGQGDRAQLLTSADGVQWTRQGTLDVRMANGEPIAPGPYGTPTAWYADGRWWLLYERRDEAVWLASSPDLKIWTNVDDQPVLRPGPDKYDQQLIAANQLLSYQGRFYLYYHGKGDTGGNWTTNVATSTDLRHWKKYEHNPLLPVQANKSSGIVVLDGNQLRLYTMHNQVQLHFPRR
ncbi:MAG: hypothetical protein AB7O38_08675 [Pirellulaceae bacterium]